MRGSRFEPWTITTRSLAVLPHSAYRLSLAFFLLLADLNLGPLPRQPCLFPQMLMKKVVNLKIRLQKCVRILQSPLSAPAILPPHLPTIWKDSQDWHSVRERFSPKIWHSGKQRTEREPAFRCYQVSWEPCAPPPLWQEVYTVRKLTPLLSSMWRNFTPFPSSRRKFTSHRVLQ